MATQSRQTTSIEFIVKPKEDLYLEGSLRTLPRVSKGVIILRKHPKFYVVD